MDYKEIRPSSVLHWNYRGFTDFPLRLLKGEEDSITDIYLKENLIGKVPPEICKLEHLESLYLSGNDITELPQEIGSLRCLKCLDVSGNRLKHIPEEIGELSRLKVLILDENDLTELPLRLVELRMLNYLSVCDNNLKWLPQRPVYNYYHCDLRFWRNTSLKTLPHSLWHHMFRNQQTRSFNIGCLDIATYQETSKHNRCRLKLKSSTNEYDYDVDCPQYNILLDNTKFTPASLYEMCKRALYQIIVDVAKKFESQDTQSLPSIRYSMNKSSETNNNSTPNTDINGNNLAKLQRPCCEDNLAKKIVVVPNDILKQYFNYLPSVLTRELRNGPASRCENLSCKRPVFDYAYYEFCYGQLLLIDRVQSVILSATFCSKSCADNWKIGRTDLIPWYLT